LRKRGITRRDARILALWALFAWEVGRAPEETIDDLFRELCLQKGVPDTPDENLLYSKKIVSSVKDNIEELDKAIARASKGWPLARMPKTDLTILRLAVAEVIYLKVPLEVAINEALDLAREFSTHASPKFLNGVLMGVFREMGYPNVIP